MKSAPIAAATGEQPEAGLTALQRCPELPAPGGDGRPTHALAHYRRGEILKRLGRKSEAAAAFAEAQRLQPDLHPAKMSLKNPSPRLVPGGRPGLADRMENTGWADLTDEALLERRIAQLELGIAGTPVEPLVAQLHAELSARGLVFLPPCHVGDEWFVPVGIPAIFIPFFLVHDRLRRLERTMMLEVEGDTPEAFMRLMRHEAAHAYAYAYQLPRRRAWQRIFGRTSADDTPEFYRPRPYSHSYVVHLDDWYAQSHPDEDFAETFAVWLTPGLDWRSRYAGWKALQKLEYVDELMSSLAGKPPTHQPAYRVADYDFLGIKLKTYYQRKRKLYEDSYPDFYDNDLRDLFVSPPAGEPALRASAYLRQRRRPLMDAVCSATNERKYRVNTLLSRLIARCDELGLTLPPENPRQDLRVAAYITTLVMNYLFTGKFKRTK